MVRRKHMDDLTLEDASALEEADRVTRLWLKGRSEGERIAAAWLKGRRDVTLHRVLRES